MTDTVGQFRHSACGLASVCRSPRHKTPSCDVYATCKLRNAGCLIHRRVVTTRHTSRRTERGTSRGGFCTSPNAARRLTSRLLRQAHLRTDVRLLDGRPGTNRLQVFSGRFALRQDDLHVAAQISFVLVQRACIRLGEIRHLVNNPAALRKVPARRKRLAGIRRESSALRVEMPRRFQLEIEGHPHAAVPRYRDRRNRHEFPFLTPGASPWAGWAVGRCAASAALPGRPVAACLWTSGYS